MKTKAFYLSLFLLLFSLTNAFSQLITEEIKVYGNCGMCETRIEKAVKYVKGVKSADWNKESKVLEVTFDSTKTTSDKIQQACAKVGHDTDLYRAKDEVYESLHSCCKYERAPARKE